MINIYSLFLVFDEFVACCQDFENDACFDDFDGLVRLINICSLFVFAMVELFLDSDFALS